LLIFIINIINTIVSIAGQAWNLSFSIEKQNKNKNISVESVEDQEEPNISVERKLNVSHLMPKTTESYTNYLQSVETHVEGPNVRIFFPCNNVWGFAACTCLFVAAFWLRGNVL
jgi:hypothetical protein